ncbi:AAA family ATPase [Pseudomonas chlororaphis]|nr:DUF3696 domain-containing protein [Pseudomonas chlororaphis]AZC64189.1 hypothetical protein C4K33_3700 [Pseudomonas chlororaphis subsp. piscium]AZC70412.1 hypothetical protein C4K32_3753 [Pseudomonas chlororaphis subsp. piscium]KZO48077.1 hypothetical protein PCL1391_3442 [Pseudomonas chlororaphis subsp. piscium]MBP5070973.1 DUF3696 domain-containing protein [Pseudomonas chlororaphis]
MISELQLKNFKSIDMDEAISLKHFSILCGSNSSGKSSLIQSILMLCQSFSNRLQDNSMMLNGHLCRLGSYQDIRSHFAKNEDVSIKFRIPLERKYGLDPYRIIEINCEVVFGTRKKARTNPEDDFHPIILSASYEVVSQSPMGIVYDVVKIRQPHDDDPISSKEDYPYHVVDFFSTSRKDRINKEFPDFNVIGAYKIGGLIPTSFLIEYNYTQKLSQHVIGLVVGDSDKRKKTSDMGADDGDISLPTCFFTRLKEVIVREREYLIENIEIPAEIMKYVRKDNQLKSLSEKDIKSVMVKANFYINSDIIEDAFLDGKPVTLRDWKLFINDLNDRTRKDLIELIDKNRVELQEAWYSGSKKEEKRDTYNSRIFSEAAEILSYYFSRNVKYLGPLRNEPQAIYASLGYIDPTVVGLKGEYTAAALHINKNKEIKYLAPIKQGTNGFTYEEKTSLLKDACQDWLCYLGVVEEFHTRDKGKLGYELYVKIAEGEAWQDLTHVGVGVSQVLPIVLMFLLSSVDDILIFEQPELHLHPKIQSRLCDLFLTMAAAKRQCIIETHSEYMINRLRLRIAQSDDQSVTDNSSVYFISKDKAHSSFENISISKYGGITSWPKDFFDQTDREIETIMMAAAKKRKMEQQKHASDN